MWEDPMYCVHSNSTQVCYSPESLGGDQDTSISKLSIAQISVEFDQRINTQQTV